MIEPPFPQSTGIQALWILQEMKEREPALLEFVKRFMESFPSESPENILLAGLAPHFREETTLLTAEIRPACIKEVYNTHFMTPKGWKAALRELKRKLQDRKVYETSKRTLAYQNLALRLFRNDLPSVQRDKRHAEILFLAVWELEALTLESEGKSITP